MKKILKILVGLGTSEQALDIFEIAFDCFIRAAASDYPPPMAFVYGIRAVEKLSKSRITHDLVQSGLKCYPDHTLIREIVSKYELFGADYKNIVEKS